MKCNACGCVFTVYGAVYGSKHKCPECNNTAVNNTI